MLGEAAKPISNKPGVFAKVPTYVNPL